MNDPPASATRGSHNRIVVVFDFDRTLCAGTIDALLGALGVEDLRHWREERLQAIVDDGWDEILAKADLLVRTARERGAGSKLIRAWSRLSRIYAGRQPTRPKVAT